MVGWLHRLHRAADLSCSVIVSSAVITVNLYYFSWHAETISVNAMTGACCVAAACSKVLKRVINQSRPAGAQKLSPGMPSNHATSLSFLSIMACTGVWMSRHARRSRSLFDTTGGSLSTALSLTAFTLYSIYACSLRVALGHHTVHQVVVGYLFGSSCALLCLVANYYHYDGNQAGGRIDDLPQPVKILILGASAATSLLALRSILRGSPLWGHIRRRKADVGEGKQIHNDWDHLEETLLSSRMTGGIGSLVHRTRRCACSFQPNLTSLTNQHNRNEQLLQFGSGGRRSIGIPRLARLEARPISILHETKHVMVAGRNYCNNFSNNQFLVVNKQSREGVFVDACDDWPDDWVAFLAASKLNPTHIFLTHCHVDNIINLNALLSIMERHTGARMGIMWCPAEQVWVDAFPRACERYGRLEEARQTLPMFHNNQYTFYTYAHQLHARQRMLERGLADGQDVADSDRPLPTQLVRHQDVLLSSATNRSTSFHDFGAHSILHYIFTPGHSPGHMMLSLPREKLLFTGDVLYYNKIGRVDLPWATGEKLGESLLALEALPDNTVILPGHGRLSTLGRERRENRALRTLYERRETGDQEVSVGFNDGYL